LTVLLAIGNKESEQRKQNQLYHKRIMQCEIQYTTPPAHVKMCGLSKFIHLHVTPIELLRENTRVSVNVKVPIRY